MELKVAKAGRGLDTALEEADAQIARQDSTADLRTAGAAPIHTFLVAFDGKTVRVRGR